MYEEGTFTNGLQFQFTRLQVGPVSHNNGEVIDSFTFFIYGHNEADVFLVGKNGDISALRGDDCSLARLEMEDFGLGSSAKDVDSIRVFLQNRVRPQGIVEVVQDKPVVTDEVEAFGCLEMSSAEEVGEDSGSAEGKAGQESPGGVRSYTEIGKAEQAAADGERNQWNNWTIHGF